MTSKRKRLEIEQKASKIILSDEENQIFWDNYYRRKYLNEEIVAPTCIICKEQVLKLESFFGCTTHKICKNCLEHARICEIQTCTFCPVPPCIFHTECIQCKHKFFTNDIHTTCPECNIEFEIKLLRIWKRGPHIYTNFLTSEEKQILKHEFHEFNGRIQCPTCRIPLERSSACNELYHCGHEKVCNACGKMSFRWEIGLHQHRKECGCANIIDHDKEALEHGELNIIKERIQNEYRKFGIL